jgi:hypothetical protein
MMPSPTSEANMRVDLFGTVHKGLRSKLFDTSVEIGRTDFGSPAETAVAVKAYRRTVGFLREHHAHESTFIEPVLHARAAALARTVRDEHEAIEAILDRMDAAFVEIESSSGDARFAIARRAVALYEDFLAAYLPHMRHEETAIQAALWEHCTDDELAALRGRLQGSIPPPRFAEWLEIMLPAMNLDERAGMLGGMKAGAPPPAFRAAVDVAKRVLGQSAWSALAARVPFEA